MWLYLILLLLALWVILRLKDRCDALRAQSYGLRVENDLLHQDLDQAQAELEELRLWVGPETWRALDEDEE